MKPMRANNSKRILDGGRRNTKKNNKITGLRIASDSNFTDSFVGTYEQFE
jgi:hypothetical protein